MGHASRPAGPRPLSRGPGGRLPRLRRSRCAPPWGACGLPHRWVPVGRRGGRRRRPCAAPGGLRQGRAVAWGMSDAPSLPAALLPIADGARAVGRSLRTVRAWVSDRKVTKWKAPEGGRNAAVFVSLSELRQYAHTRVATGAEDVQLLPAPRRAVSHAELADLRADHARCRAELAGARETIAVLRDAVRARDAAFAALQVSHAETLRAERARADGRRGG